MTVLNGLLGVLLIAACARRGKEEYDGLGKSASTFGISLGIVAAYYGILVAWLWHIIPLVAAHH